MNGTSGLINSTERTAYRPRISRETRRLLLTALIAVLALWALARVRFPDRPATPNPVPPLLSQISTGARFSDLASAVGDLRARLDPLLVTLVPADLARVAGRPGDRLAALRLHDDLALAILPPQMRGDERDPLGVIAEDPVSGLAVVRVGVDGPALPPAVWTPETLDEPRYLIASSPSRMSMSLRPAFVGSLTPVEAPEWNGTVWALPRDATMAPGTFLFTEDAALVGAIVTYGAGVAVVPGAALLAQADGLTKAPPPRPGELGIDVQPLTPMLSVASGAETGIVVSWVDPKGAAAGRLVPGDVITAADGTAVPTPDHWTVRAARVRAGEPVTLMIIRNGGAMDVVVTAVQPADGRDGVSLGMVLRAVPRIGSEVVAVDPGSAAASSGIEPGDLITTFDRVSSPGPAQVRSAYASATRGQLLIAVLKRRATHRVVALQR